MAAIRFLSPKKSVATAVLVALGIALVSNAAQGDEMAPPELVQYIRDTKRRGAADAAIKSQAVAIGWPAAVIDEALAYVRNEQTPQKIAPDPAPASSPAPARAEKSSPEAASPKPIRNLPESSSGRGAPDDYVIGPGDTLQISVWKEPEVSVPLAVVRPDGKITVPLIKQVEVAGLTPQQAERRIADGLTTFIADANVTVVVATVTSKKVYVIGAARKEGPLPYTYRMTVMQALSEAGGLTYYAKRRKIYILRTENGREYRLDFNYDEVVKGESMEQNILLLAGDTIVIPQ